jgi:hypothetical protein
MKTKIILTITTIFISAAQLVAQPHPPTGPNGNPVPVSSVGFFALLAGFLFIYFRNKKTTNKQ